MSADELRYAEIQELSGLLRSRRLSSVELTSSVLDRLEAIGPSYNAVAEVTRQTALKQAARADHQHKSSDVVSPLCGIPYGAKDLLATKGIPTRWGSPAYSDQVFPYNATVIERLEKAGAVLTAKLAMVELAGTGDYRWASASANGPCLNPWDVTRWSGGSSSGSGASVAAGLVPFALGSETGGSIVIPSSFCGVTGLRPTHGAVSRYGVQPVAWSLDKIGPMARSAYDCGLVLHAIAGLDTLDATTHDWTYRRVRKRRFRVGVLPEDLDGYGPTRHRFHEAIEVLESLGMHVQEVALPPHDYRGIYQRVLAGETASAHESFITSPRVELVVDETQRQGIKKYLDVSPLDYVRAAEARVEATRDIRALFRSVDVLASPTVLTEATPIAADLTEWRQRRHYASLGAVAGVPGISIPMGFGASDLPLGLSLTGDRFGEGTILRCASLFQQETDWHKRRPPEVIPA